MKAIITTPGKAGSVRLGSITDPSGTGSVEGADGKPAESVDVEVVEVGVCGTDLEIATQGYGAPPPGRDSLVLGHENLGRVLTAPAGSELSSGQLVVATVRRPCPERCQPCAAGQSDDCLTGHYTERGIKGRDGYMAERYVESGDYLIPLPATLAKVGVLMEPSSIVEKGLIQAFSIQRTRMPWDPKQALICGAGAIGLLAAIFLRLRDIEVSLVARSDPDLDLRQGGQGCGGHPARRRPAPGVRDGQGAGPDRPDIRGDGGVISGNGRHCRHRSQRGLLP